MHYVLYLFNYLARQILITMMTQIIYDFLGMELTPEARAEMEQWQDFNRRELRPTHEYSLEQFGFTELGLKRQFRGYRERFIA